MINYHGLLKKGFSKKDARKTVEIIQKAKKRKSPKVRFLDAVVYWALLIVAIIGNVVISIILIPFLLSFKKVPLYSVIFILALMFGSLFDQLIREIENLEHKHQIIAWVFIPVLALINVYYMVSFTNHLTEVLGLPVSLNSPLLVSILYVVAFMFPYIIREIVELSKS